MPTCWRRKRYWLWAFIDTLWMFLAAWCLCRVSPVWAFITAIAYLALPQGWFLARAWVLSLAFQALLELLTLLVLPEGNQNPQLVEMGDQLYFYRDACASIRPWRLPTSLLLGLLLWCRVIALLTLPVKRVLHH